MKKSSIIIIDVSGLIAFLNVKNTIKVGGFCYPLYFIVIILHLMIKIRNTLKISNIEDLVEIYSIFGRGEERGRSAFVSFKMCVRCEDLELT